MISTERLTDLFVEVADTLVADFDLIDFLHNLTQHAAAISRADAVGLMLADHHGKLRFMAASNDTGEMLELLQLQNSEGPCLDCYSSGEPVVNADLAGASERWPLIAPAACGLPADATARVRQVEHRKVAVFQSRPPGGLDQCRRRLFDRFGGQPAPDR